MPKTRYDDYESGAGSSGDYEDDHNMIISTYATVETEFDRAFGADGEYGQSIGLGLTDTVMLDGCLYADPDKQKLKLFSWRESNDLSPIERFDRDEDPHAEDASDLIRKSYAGTEKEYELVGARVDEVVDEEGETVVEASSVIRDFEFTDDGIDFGDWEDLGGDPVPVPDTTVWYSGSEDGGPSVSAQTLAETLTRFGTEAVTDEDNVYDWFAGDSSGDNVLREDLEGRRVRFFVVTRQGEDYTYNLPIVEDIETGEQIQPNNFEDGDTGNSDSSESDAVQEAAALDEGDYPEPVADFLSSGAGLNLTEERADTLLDDLIESADNAMTAEMVEDFGGKEALIAEVV